ncbi:MAG: TRAP transporter small permease subunit [Oscillospiraceae bacterium]|nr:TRAP transporter small permease subunit [Oscillospiraceae bacterium]
MRYPKFMVQVNKLGAYICGGIVFIASALAVMESILRKLFASPTTWTLNLSTAIFIWAAFLGSSWAFQELGHVSVDLIRDIIDRRTKSKKRWPRRIMSLIGYLMSFVTVTAFLYGGWKLCVRAVQYNQLAPYHFKFPMVISYAAIVVGSVLMLCTLVFIVLDLLAGGDKYM